MGLGFRPISKPKTQKTSIVESYIKDHGIISIKSKFYVKFEFSE